ncbi:Short-chain dehydrogenase/reductase SDR [Enhygromyxa salina]|uniref:Short-chain dehydrogenase/reductase SDR n=1 Tax=Enhygromyxa salina TaxID=215803 RepID=A0A0C2CW99_9BACT|nr:SDR family oxidoreductase [Enhygromyxa salina]KIG13900.1 Short-chain dehydrogenase/reductase SDR [Enhygromyxa salina]
MTSSEHPKPPFPRQQLDPPGLDSDLDPAPRWRAPDYCAAGKLSGKRALITGGDSGIGRAVAYLFAREGADVAITHLASEASDAARVRQAIESCGQSALTIVLDQREYAACERAVAEVINCFRGLDILVNNAAFQRHRKFEALELEQWRETFETNIYGYFHMTKAALPHLGEGAAIINTGSVTGLEGSGELVDYAATKGAIHAFTKSLAQGLLGRKIRVNCVAPGPVWTPLNPAEREPDDIVNFGASQPIGRPAQPEEIAPVYVYFACNADSSYVTGEVFSLLGGQIRTG